MRRSRNNRTKSVPPKEETPDSEDPSYEEYKQFVEYAKSFSYKTNAEDELWDYLLFGGYDSDSDSDDSEMDGGGVDGGGERCPKGTRRKGKLCVPTEPKVKVDAEPLVVPPAEEQTTKPAKTAMNQFLNEKENLERKQPLLNHDYLYPDLTDPEFNTKLALKKEFQDAQYDGKIYDIEKQANILCSAKFELSSHQIFVRNFLSEQTPYKGLLLYHGLGTGKTCSAIGVAEETRHYLKRTGVRQQIIVVASPNVQGNFRQQLFDERKLRKITNAANPNEYTWNIESCVGNSLLNEVNPNSIKNLTREKLISNINALINENYAFVGYIQFANIVRATMGSPEEKDLSQRNLRRFFDNRLIIVDEVHNIRLADDSNQKEMQQVGATLMMVAQQARGVRLLLLSATPMFNSYKEIVWLVNLLNVNDGRAQIQVSDVFNGDGTFREAKTESEESGEELLRRKLTGYVSYVRGENPYTFPYRIYPRVFSPEHALIGDYPRTQMNGLEIEKPIEKINVYVNRVLKDTYQMRAYGAIIEFLRRKSQGFYKQAAREMPNFDNMESFGYTMLQRPLEALNIVYPDEDLTEVLGIQDVDERADSFSDELFQNAVGGVGLSRAVSFLAMENEEPLKHDYEYLPNVVKKYGRIFSPTELPKYSAKMAEICRAIKNSEGIVLIYSQYIDGGVVPMALALEEMGFGRYCSGHPRHRHLFKRPAAPAIDAITMEPNPKSAHNAQYIMITGDKGLSPSNTEDVKYATNPDNLDGSRVKVVIISKAGSEGLDFKAIRQIHILEPWFNMNRIEQIIGRGVRNLSHCALPFKKRNVEIYLHATMIEGSDSASQDSASEGQRSAESDSASEGQRSAESDSASEAADMYLYRLAERKAIEIGRVSRVIKDSAADCLLNIGQTNLTAEKLSAIVANQKIRIQTSSKEGEIYFQIGDLDGSEICDYMSCEYQCIAKKPANQEEEKTTYTEANVMRNINYISGRIKSLYRERHVYTLAQLTAEINAVRIYPVEQIYYVLSKFVNNKNMYLFDKYGRFGYLINRKKFYEFQPIEITDERSSVFERSRPVDFKQSNIILEVPKEFREQLDTNPTAQLKTSANSDYAAIIQDIEKQLRLLEDPQQIKSDEKDWYKNASRVIEHVKVVYGLTDDDITRYAVFHYLDSSTYETKRVLFESTYNQKVFSVSPAIEELIVEYFRPHIMHSNTGQKVGIFLADKESARLISMTAEDDDDEVPALKWVEGAEATHFTESTVDKRKLNDIVGYMLQFKDQDMAFYYKDIHLQRNKKGRRCDRSGGKEPIIKILNRVVGVSRYNAANVDVPFFYSGSLCVVLEMVLRHMHTKKRIYYLTPEQAIRSNITDFSSTK
jgi:hypothetical protein